jgi:hypothetical protein
VSSKFKTLNPKKAGFNYLLSFSDKTHLDNQDLRQITKGVIDTGNRCERLVLKWIITHDIDGEDNELAVVIRISNPINPLLFFQAALSKSAQDIDNFEFEMGSTCASVTGAGQLFSDEVFQLIQNWINARDKPYAMIGINEFIKDHRNKFYFLNLHLLPFLLVFILMCFAGPFKDKFSFPAESFVILSFLLYFSFRDIGRSLNEKMQRWNQVSNFFSVFQLTTGDNDFITKMLSKSKNSSLKVLGGVVYSLLMNIGASVVFIWLTKK